MKRVITAAVLVAALAIFAGTASAEELWNPHLRGTDEGLAAGALPPKGVYLINDLYFVTWKETDGNSNAIGPKLDSWIDIPIILWNPGIKVLGADYAAAIAQPFDYTSVEASGITGGNGHTGTFNTVVIPGLFSWKLPMNFYVKTGLAVYVDDASSATGKYAPPNHGAGAGNGFWTLEPRLGISWLYNGWNLSGDFYYDYNLKNTTTGYNSGNMFDGDYTATKEIGKWTVGVGGYSQNQLEKDKLNGVTVSNKTRIAYGIGPIAGYDFGPVSLMATWNYGLVTHHDFGGDFFNLRLVAPIF